MCVCVSAALTGVALFLWQVVDTGKPCLSGSYVDLCDGMSAVAGFESSAPVSLQVLCLDVSCIWFVFHVILYIVA